MTIKINENFKKTHAVVYWADDDGKYVSNLSSEIAIPNDKVTEWDNVPSDCVGLLLDRVSALHGHEVYAYAQINITGRKDRKIPYYGYIGRKVKVTFLEGEDTTTRDAFVTNLHFLTEAFGEDPCHCLE